MGWKIENGSDSLSAPVESNADFRDVNNTGGTLSLKTQTVATTNHPSLPKLNFYRVDCCPPGYLLALYDPRLSRNPEEELWIKHLNTY